MGEEHIETNFNKNEKTQSDSDFEASGWGYRHQQCIVLFVCLTAAYSLRACMGVALVGMIEHENEPVNYTDVLWNSSEILGNVTEEPVTHINGSAKEEFKTVGLLNALLLIPPYPQFTWEKRIQNALLSSFFWGYMVLQIPAGILAHKYGARRLLVGALMINGISSFCFPWVAYYGGWICTMLCRMLQGLSQACVVPSLHTFFGLWSPLEERSRLSGFAAGGQALGTVLGLPISGFLASSSLGWPGIFRFFGIVCILVGVLVHIMIADTPAQHPKISKAERQYIEEGVGQKDGEAKKHLSVPWSRLLRNRGLHASIVAHIGQTWGQLTLFTEVPSFMDKVMGVNIKANGLLTALPFLVMWFTSFFFNWFTDMLIVKKIVSVTNARKSANSLGFIPAGIGLIVLAFAPKNIYVVETLLIIICAFKISAHVGFMVSCIDITPNFAGTMISITNFASNLVGSQAPMVAGLLINDVTSEYEWRKVFFVAAGFYFVTNLIYVIFGTSEKADWDQPQESQEENLKNLENAHETVPMLDKQNGKEDLISPRF